MSATETFIEEVAKAKGITRQRLLYALRGYIKEKTDKELTDAVNRITSIPYLKILWEAGLNAALQQEVAYRIRELEKRRELKSR